MKTLYLVILCIVYVTHAFPQNLSDARQSSYYTLIFSITNDEARDLFVNRTDPHDGHFHTLFDFFPTDSTYQKQLPVGHYVFVAAKGGNLEYKLESVDNIDMRVLNNHRDLMMVLFDRSGRPTSDAKVKIGRKDVAYHNETGSFRLPKSSKHGIVEVNYQDHVSFFRVTRLINNTWVVRRVRGFMNFFPIRYLIVSPIDYVIDNTKSLIQYGQAYPPGIYHRVRNAFNPPVFNGYMVFNKPKFRPNDTVRVKAFVTRRKGKPVNRNAELVLATSRGEVILKPFSKVRKGVYHNSFVLADSLDLILDRNYWLRLRDRRMNQIQTNSFRYEAYELKQNEYHIRAMDNEEHIADILYLRGTDSNDQPLFDVTADVLLRVKKVHVAYPEHEFIPDTLWNHTLDLDPLGETKVAVPDSVYPDASFDYEVLVSFSNAENEVVYKTLDLSYNSRPFPVSARLERDSIYLSFLEDVPLPSGKAVSINFFEYGGSATEEKVELPFKRKLNPVTASFSVRYGESQKSWSVDSFGSTLDFSAGRTVDSLHIASINPRNLTFHYFIFRNNSLLEKGSGSSLNIKRSINKNDTYSLSVQYVWGGQSQELDYQIPLEKRDLSVLMDLPQQVFPGQQVEVGIRVTDFKGHPVEGAELAAYSTTRKFGMHGVTEVPRWPSPQKDRRVFNRFNELRGEVNGETWLDLAYWKKQLGLDSLLFYKFIFPQEGWFEIHEVRSDSITQFSPFVVDSGRVAQVHVVYIDERPVYYSRTETIQPYSFRIGPGEHTVKLRIADALVTVEHFSVERGKRVIFSIDRANAPEGVTIVPMDSWLTDQEAKKLSRYFLKLRKGVGQQFSYMQQDSNIFLVPITPHNSYAGDNMVLSGPFVNGSMKYVVRDKFSIHTNFEPFFSYEFAPELVNMKGLETHDFINRFDHASFKYNLGDSVITRASVNNYWSGYDKSESRFIGKYPESIDSGKVSGGRLMIEGHLRSEPSLSALFMINLDSPDEFYIFSNTRDLTAPFSEGKYQLVVVFDDSRYLLLDSLVIRPYGINCYNLKDLSLHDPDAFSRQVIQMIDKWATESSYSSYTREREMYQVRRLYYESSTIEHPFWPLVSGRVVEADGDLPIPGVNVVVKGTTVGTTTDMDGYYRINCPEDGTLIYSFIGYQTVEQKIDDGSFDVVLTPDVTALSEVVVTALGVQYTSSLSASVSTVHALQGQVAGISIKRRGITSEAVNVAIRGVRTLDPSAESLVVIDGIFAKRSDIEGLSVVSMEVIDGVDAVALYGARASGGVILISTKKDLDATALRKTMPPLQHEPMFPGASSIRRNFRDYAFWQPSMRTDRDGNARFTVTFPDDITGWNVYALGMASRKRTGQTSATLHSFKPLMAQVALPHFLIEGDSSCGIGKLTHYGDSSVLVRQQIRIGANSSDQREMEFAQSHVDTLALRASDSDSLEIEYTIELDNGYKDGEIRKVPVYRKGTTEATGVFVGLKNDTTMTMPFDVSKGPVKLYAQADLLDVLLDEIRYLKEYPYECNEQTASRLRAMLLERKISLLKKERWPAHNDSDIEKVIRKLAGNQNQNGSWDWWENGGSGSWWITLHAARVLDDARSDGFNVAIDEESMNNYIISGLSSSGVHRLEALVYLSARGERFSEDELIRQTMDSAAVSVRQKLLAQRFLQLADKPVAWGWIDSLMQRTIKGNVYWGEHSEHLLDNSIQCSLLVYELIEARDPSDPRLSRIRNFFLERRGRRWRNTFESASILETILPSLMQGGSGRGTSASLIVQSATIDTTNRFPYEQVITGGSSVTVTKTGLSPVYLTIYQESWNPNPQADSTGNFMVTTSLDSSRPLESGKAVELEVKVTVKEDAEYVMIEIPIPAGCSYDNRRQSQRNGEVYREYYHNKANIYCEFLKKGVYAYTISLMPRFSGRYTINPAVAECMYFPTIYGRTAMRSVDIK